MFAKEKIRLLKILSNSLETRIGQNIKDTILRDKIMLQQERMSLIGEMLNSIVHQLGQPLNNIHLVCQCIQGDISDKTINEQTLNSNIAIIMDSLKYISETINGFRLFMHEEVIILDNAGGVPDDIIERIFDNNFSTKEHSKGLGIGLTMSKLIIEQNMNGTLQVHNNNGVTFHII